MTEEELKHRLGRKWRINVMNLKVLVDSLLCKAGGTSIGISTHSPFLQRRYGCNLRQLAKIINMALDVGLLRLDNKRSNYAFGHHDMDDNYSRCFYFDEEIACKVNRIANSAHMLLIPPSPPMPEHINKNKELSSIEDKPTKKETSGLPDISFGLDYDYFVGIDEELLNLYPQIGFYNEYLVAVNSQYDRLGYFLYTFLNPNSKYRHESNSVRFGIRAYSGLCSLPKIPGCTVSRVDVLDDWFGKGNWKEYDLNASIYRIARSCRDGKWYDSTEDVYMDICCGDLPVDRSTYKVMCNIAAFCKSSGSFCSAVRQKARIDIRKNRLSCFEQFINSKNSELEPLYDSIIAGIGKFCGKFGTEVFLHESCIMIGAAYRIIMAGFKAALLFDCMFVETGAYGMVEGAIRDSFGEYYCRFVNEDLHSNGFTEP